MSDSILAYARHSSLEFIPGVLVPFVRARFLEAFANLAWGCIQLHDDAGVHQLGHAGNPGPQVCVRVHDHDFYAYAGLGGSVGAGQSYFLGLWDADALEDLVRIVVHDRATLAAVDGGLARLGQPLYRWFHRSRANTREQARSNIEAHYDLGNAFFTNILDEDMNYSAAIYPAADSDLDTAQRYKLDVLCSKLDLGPEDRLLEIGTGWGALAVHAAARYGAHVTSTTLSQAQYAAADERVRRAGLEDRVELLTVDYRELTGQYDKIVSVEMIEAVGYEYLPDYFEQVSRLLKPDGLALIQAITIEDQDYARYRDGIDFIRRFVFPGGCLPALSVMLDMVSTRTDLRALHVEDLGDHYARTIADWRTRFEANVEAIRSLGYDERFVRLWRFYLAFCEGGFRERSISDVHLLLEKRDGRHPVPATAIAESAR